MGLIYQFSKNEELTDVKSSIDETSHTYYLSFENGPERTKVKIDW